MSRQSYPIISSFCVPSLLLWVPSGCPKALSSCLPRHPSHNPSQPIPLCYPSPPGPSTMYHASNLDWLIHFIYDIIHVSVPFSQIIPPSSSPTESKRLFYTSVSLLLSCIQGYRYHLSKFHIYALLYCIGVFLSLCIIGSSFIHFIRTDSSIFFLTAE